MHADKLEGTRAGLDTPDGGRVQVRDWIGHQDRQPISHRWVRNGLSIEANDGAPIREHSTLSGAQQLMHVPSGQVGRICRKRVAPEAGRHRLTGNTEWWQPLEVKLDIYSLVSRGSRHHLETDGVRTSKPVQVRASEL